MYFDIAFTQFEKDKKSIRGRIIIDDFNEEFISNLTYWTKVDYESNWLIGIRRVNETDSDSYLITDIYDPKRANYIFLWLIYNFEDYVIFRNHLLPINKLHPFEVSDFYNRIPKYSRLNDEGIEISEWRTSKKSLIDFLERRKKQ